MKLSVSTMVTFALALLCAGAAANEPVDPHLDYAASNLNFATTQLVNAIRAAQGDSHVEMDAETLNDAAEHFKEEVELGPEDLEVDFATMNQTYNEMRNELSQSNVIRYNLSARQCWFNTQESYIALRQAWLGHIGPGPDERSN